MSATEPESARKSPRRYRRLSPSERAEALARWRTGAETLSELASAYGVSQRALQYAFSKEGAAKGEAIAEDARRIERETIAEAFGAPSDRIEQGRAARRRSLDLAKRIESAAAAIIVAIETDPPTAGAHAGSLRTLNLAMQLVERGFSVKAAALGLSANDVDQEELPQIIIRDLSEEELAAIRAANEDDDE